MLILWFQDLTLRLIRRNDNDQWTPTQTIFENRRVAAGSEAWNWTMPEVGRWDVLVSAAMVFFPLFLLMLFLDRWYSLWLTGSESAGSGCADITAPFRIERVGGPLGRETSLVPLEDIGGVLVEVVVVFLVVFTAATAVVMGRTVGGVRDGPEKVRCDLTESDLTMDEETEAWAGLEEDRLPR
jgi:hypothetical protein